MADLPFVPKDDEAEEESTGDVADSDLVAAAEAAFKASGGEATKAEADKTRDEQGRFVKQPTPPKEEKPSPSKEKPSSIIARELAKREAARAEAGQYKTKIAEAQQMHAQAQQLFQQLQEQRDQLAKEREEIAAARRDPAQFLAKQGWQAEQFIDLATQSKNPLYQETVALRQQLETSNSAIAELRQVVRSLQAKAEGYDKQSEQAHVAAEVDAFWKSFPEDSPVWKEYEDKEDILYKARRVRQQYYERTGKVASPQELAQYLHYKALEKRAPSAETAAKPNAGKTKAKVPRALGGQDASERRSGNGMKHIHDMTPDEERQYLMDVATNAVTGAGD